MDINQELLSYLENNIRDKDTKARNIAIIAYFYGFGKALWPTLDETAAEFGIGTRERVRQLINENFRNYVDLTCLPSIGRMIEIIKSKRFWTQTELEEKLIEQELVGDDFSIRGLFNLMDDLGMDNNYGIYSPNLDLEEATRNSLDRYEQNFIVNNNDAKIVRSIFKKAQKLPGRTGIANLNYLEKEFKNYNVYANLLSDLIKYSDNAWIKIEGENSWFLFENKNNILINYSEKVFSVINICDAKRLAEAYKNALNRRTNKYPYPPIEIILDYLRSSIYFENNKDMLTFIGETNELNGIEKEVFEFLKTKSSIRYPELRSYLELKQYGEPYIRKVITSSPLVYVDKNKGRYNHEYSLVSKPKEIFHEDDLLNNRYKQFVLKMRNISIRGTDETVEQKRRREQRLLQQWLFEDKNQEYCAICGKRFSVNALVAAHKKRRSDCNEAERLDPHIVFPLCVFGCDYLYENKYLIIEDGFIKEGLPIKEKGYEQDFVKKLVGRKINDEWLMGPETYFKTAY
jgi:hypothetical protein